MTQTPHDDSSGATAGPGQVPAQPVVQIEIFGSTVSVNGVVIVHDGTQSLHHVAVHAAAERVAKVLGRPVRAQAIDAEGRATLVVHPDGHASDVELVETYETEADAVAATTAVVAPAAPVFSSFSNPDALLSGPPVYGPPTTPPPAGPPTGVPAGVPLAATAAMPAVAAAHGAPTGPPPQGAPAPRPASGAPSGWPSKVVRMVAVAAALVAVIGTGVLLLTGGSDDTPDTRTTSAETTPTPSVEATPTPSVEPTPSASPAAPVDTAVPVVEVKAVRGINQVRLEITTDTVPGAAEVALTPAGGGKVVKKTITLDAATTAVSFDSLAAGTATWRVSVTGAEPVKGQVVVDPPYVAPTPTPTPTPVVPAAPAPVAPSSAPAPAPAPAPKPSPKPATKAPSSGGGGSTFGSKSKNKFKDKGSKGTTSGPVDPDDRAVTRVVTLR